MPGKAGMKLMIASCALLLFPMTSHFTTTTAKVTPCSLITAPSICTVQTSLFPWLVMIWFGQYIAMTGLFSRGEWLVLGRDDLFTRSPAARSYRVVNA
jgi:hypothetical protein